LSDLVPKIAKLIHDLRPDAIVTWGPDGGYGHPDHRLVSALVSQVVAEGGVTPLLYYVAVAKSRMTPDVAKGLSFLAPFSPTADEDIQLRVPYSPSDSSKAKEALHCHKSQFESQSMDQLQAINEKMNQGTIFLRRWNGGPVSNDVFYRK
jgi:N-acetyl-1-D-myo-inositol-2-amino-2-deoxy-alpha-D-glucopyranoside deacetylase